MKSRKTNWWRRKKTFLSGSIYVSIYICSTGNGIELAPALELQEQWADGQNGGRAVGVVDVVDLALVFMTLFLSLLYIFLVFVCVWVLSAGLVASCWPVNM